MYGLFFLSGFGLNYLIECQPGLNSCYYSCLLNKECYL